MKLLLAIFLLLGSTNSFADFNSGDTFGKGMIIQNNGITLTGGGRTLNFTSGVTVANNAYVISTSSGGGGGTPGGTPTQLQYNSGGSFAGVTGSGVDANGNVGIGSAVPGQKLDVQGTVRSSLGFSGPGTGLTGTASSLTSGLVTAITGQVSQGTNVTITGAGTTGSPYVINSSGSSGGTPGGGINAVQYNSPLGSFAGKEQTFSFNGTNVGIGTSNGTSLLDVRGNASATGTLAVTGTSSLNGNVGVGVAPGSTPLFVQASGGLGVGVRSITGNNLAYVTSEGSSGPTAEYGNLILANNNTQLISLDANNNPNLSIKSNTSNPVLYLGANSSSGPGAQQGILELEDTGVVEDIINSGGPSYINVGNLGIGSANPGQLFDVHGTARVSGFVMPTNAASGYILTSNAVGIGTWQPAPTGGGGTPSGGLNAVQYNSPLGSFAGKEQTFSFNGTNVGIGTTNGNQSLDVRGTIQGITVNGTSAVQLNGTPVAYSITGDGLVIGNSASTGAVTLTTKAQTQNTVLGAATSTTLAALTLPSCSGASNALIWTTSTGYGCNTFTIPVRANPTASIGLTAVNGTSGSFTSSDSAPALSQAISPTWTGNHIFAPSSGNTVFTSGNVGIGSATPGSILDIQGTARIYGNVGIGTSPTSYTLMVNGPTQIIGAGNVGIGSINPGVQLDVNGTVRFNGNLVNTKSTVGIGWSEHNATNQACNTTCGTSACVMALDIGTVGIINSGFVSCSDATADDCECAGP